MAYGGPERIVEDDRPSWVKPVQPPPGRESEPNLRAFGNPPRR